ncbi:ribonuclease H-like domain-containing protein [Sporosarcina sp. HYO08]|uniref:ribonuclease H-like domain-containing protein n=1 Tax=Sporosarcina sp. HYO08 TaxID=1759557 RepID=UPI00079BA10B|nr:ribonuclease H-like domain-containing protein [Sporosarcina sp. HYO08]KXH81982.1 hypothetical protein AU377_06920 [Sporosarcina sp. HYO08]
MSYEQKLMAMKKLLHKKEKTAPEKQPILAKPPAPSYEKEWLSAGVMKEEHQMGIVYKRIVEYDANHFHGNIRLGDLTTTLTNWKRAPIRHPLSPDPSKPLLFFDTETTGLKGTGTLIFLMGFIEQTADTFTLTQYVLPGPDHEAAFLYASPFWKDAATVITYNGKSFDLPQLETRWTMNRNDLPPLLKHDQIDLLHGSRRIWKDAMGSFKLTAVEERQLGFYRQDDIPGHMAPIIYQDAVKSGRAELLMKVLEHNEWDILSLVALYIRSTDLLLKEADPESAITHTNIGKWFADLKSHDQSRAFFEQTIAKYGENHPMTHYHFGFSLKRIHEYEKAANAFKVAAEALTGRHRIIALEELAKLYEHKLKSLHEALTYTKEAMEWLENDGNLTFRFKERATEAFTKREIRIMRKYFPGKRKS